MKVFTFQKKFDRICVVSIYLLFRFPIYLAICKMLLMSTIKVFRFKTLYIAHSKSPDEPVSLSKSRLGLIEKILSDMFKCIIMFTGVINDAIKIINSNLASVQIIGHQSYEILSSAES